MAQHLLVKMLMVSLPISGKQKIATAEVMRQFAGGMEIFLIIKINKSIMCDPRCKVVSYAIIIIIKNNDTLVCYFHVCLCPPRALIINLVTFHKQVMFYTHLQFPVFLVFFIGSLFLMC